MSKRLFMTSADYLAIAVSPALIMALIGSLVFFLLDVLYVGDYQARLTYVFALYVFATVLVSRIAIEDGREYAALFAIPLGLATLLVLMKFMEHASGWNYLTNVGLVLVIWWCADKLTWDCTLIDDDEDSSGEGLLQRIGVDDNDGQAESEQLGAKSNELFDGPKNTEPPVPWWQRVVRRKRKGHAPGLWVLYFSLAALPLFGIGQHWVPASHVGRRRYVFGLLLVYVAAALSLLVTTSFLGLRRYLRQRLIEMPNPMAVTWVAVGAALIGIVMLIALLIPRPNAEYAISQVPWRARSPAGLSSSRAPIGNDAPKDQQEQTETGQVVDEHGPKGEAVKPGQGERQSSQGRPSEESGEGESEQKLADKSAQPSNDDSSKSGDAQQSSSKQASDQNQGPSQATSQDTAQQSGDNSKSSVAELDKSHTNQQSANANSSDDGDKNGTQLNNKADDETPSAKPPQHSAPSRGMPKLPNISAALGGLGGLLKLLLYLAAAAFIIFMAWKHRRELIAAIHDILQQLRELLARLFGSRSNAAASADEESKPATKQQRRFADFRNPFATGDYKRIPPDELVRYTFDAFEAWARDGGYARSPDQTPAELVRFAAPPGSSLQEPARLMLRIYCETAYGAAAIDAETAYSLREFWAILSSTSPGFPEMATPATSR